MELPEQSSFLLLSAIISVKIPSLSVGVSGQGHPEVLLLPTMQCVQCVGRLAGGCHYSEQICGGEMGREENRSWRIKGGEVQPDVSSLSTHLRPC